jgi:prepilin-type N-terminal cleavage/methylation domain-containing protein
VRRAQRGFTLLEVIVALTILAMSILLVTRAFLILLSVTNKGGNQTVAASLAVRKLEEVRSSVESQNSTLSWTQAFCSVQNQALAAFGVPYTNYQYEVSVSTVNSSVLTPGQSAWLDYSQPSPCPADPALEPSANHENNVKWIVVRVYFSGQTTPLAVVSSAVIRDMYRRP